MINRNPRTVIAMLVLSAAGLVGIATNEDYTSSAVIPVPGDVPTIGFGTTEGVKMGDKITPPKALARALADVQKYEGAIKQCVKVPLYQYEYDAYTSLAYNIGVGGFCNSTLVKKLNQEDYADACAQILVFQCGPAPTHKAANPGEPCYRSDGKPRMVIRGLQNRRNGEFRQCMGEGAS